VTPPAGSRLARAAWPLLAVAIPLGVLVASPSRTILPPANVDWLTRGDAAQHQLGWEFYAREPRSLSPRVASWPHPAGTTVGLTDSIPLVAVPLRLLAGARAAPFQYFGLWAAGCVAALGAVGAVALRRLGLPPAAAAFGGALVGFDPVLWQRLERGHFSLCAQALLLAAMVAWMRAREGGPPRTLWPFGALAVAAAAIHPYLALLVFALWAGALAFETRRVGFEAWTRHAPVGAAALCAAGLVAVGSGFVTPGATLAAGGFGSYRADLAALLNPADRSRFLPPLFGGPTLAEGFAYLGAGALGLGAIAVGVALRERRRRAAPEPAPPPPEPSTLALREIGWTAAVLAALAALPAVSAFGLELFDLGNPPDRIEELLGVFRANGRLAWPLRLFVLLAIARGLRPLARRPARLALVFAVAAAVQALEPPTSDPSHRRAPVDSATLEAIRTFGAGARHLALVPPMLADGGGALCGGRERIVSWERPGAIAARLGWTYDSGLFARLDRAAARATCRGTELRGAPARADTVYAVAPRLVRRLRRRGEADCRRFERDLWLCRSPISGGGAGSAAATSPASPSTSAPRSR
jgi:hypothetical protein